MRSQPEKLEAADDQLHQEQEYSRDLSAGQAPMEKKMTLTKALKMHALNLLQTKLKFISKATPY
jgi:hypothetical protein